MMARAQVPYVNRRKAVNGAATTIEIEAPKTIGSVYAVRPKALKLKTENIPIELRELTQWVCWHYVERIDDKTGASRWTKAPIHPNRNPASTTDPLTWSSFDECVAVYKQGLCDGIGFVTSGDDPYVLIDLDHVIDRSIETVADWAREIIAAAKYEGAYVEASPSGTGVHIIGVGVQRLSGRKANGAEMYYCGRFFTITGQLALGGDRFVANRIKRIERIATTVELVTARLDMGKPQEPNKAIAPVNVGVRPYPANMTDTQILEQAFESKTGVKLKRLLDGDIGDYANDASAADLACASMLAFWFWLDPTKIEDVMRDSKLMRDKWDTTRPDPLNPSARITYLQMTIGKALAGNADYFGKIADRPDFSDDEPKDGMPDTSTPDKNPPSKRFDYKAHMKPAQALIDNPPPPIEYLVTDLLARGASVLFVGKPKSFKTTVATQVALALCGNKKFLAEWAVFGTIKRAYRVAIIDYEQSEQIAAQMIARFQAKKAKGLLRLDAFPKLDESGVGELRRLIVEEKLDAVIVDSWTRAQPELKNGKGVFMGEGEIMQRITKLAHETGCLIIVIAHAGKRDAADDPMQMIAGTNALPASVDDVLVLFKDGEDEGQTVRRKLFVSGRNIAKHGTYVLEKRDIDVCFVLKGSEESYVRGEMRRKILGLLAGGGALSPKDLAVTLGRNRGQMHHALASLVAEKLVVPIGGGKYQRRTDAAKDAIKAQPENTDE